MRRSPKPLTGVRFPLPLLVSLADAFLQDFFVFGEKNVIKRLNNTRKADIIIVVLLIVHSAAGERLLMTGNLPTLGGVFVEIDDLNAKELEELSSLPMYKDFYGEYRYGLFGASEQIHLNISDKLVSGRGYIKEPGSKKKIAAGEFSLDINDFIGFFPKEFDGKTVSALCPKLMNKTFEIYFPGFSVSLSELKKYFKLYLYAQKFRETLSQKLQPIYAPSSVSTNNSYDSAPSQDAVAAALAAKTNPVSTARPVRKIPQGHNLHVGKPANPETHVANAEVVAETKFEEIKIEEVNRKELPIEEPISDTSSIVEEVIEVSPEAVVQGVKVPTSGSKEADQILDDEILDFKGKVEKLRIMKESGIISDDEFQIIRKKLTNILG